MRHVFAFLVTAEKVVLYDIASQCDESVKTLSHIRRLSVEIHFSGCREHSIVDSGTARAHHPTPAELPALWPLGVPWGALL